MAASPIALPRNLITPPTAPPGAPLDSPVRHDAGDFNITRVTATPRPGGACLKLSSDGVAKTLDFGSSRAGTVLPWLAPVSQHDGSTGIAVVAAGEEALQSTTSPLRVVSIFGKAR